MTDARTDILARIRAALDTGGTAPPAPRDYRRTGTYPPGHPELARLFTERLTDYAATVYQTSPAGVRATLAQALTDILPVGGRLIAPQGLPAAWTPDQAIIDDGSLDATQLDHIDVAVTGCAAACAETGTIALDGTAGQGRRAITLVPDRHICLVHATQIVQTVPELLTQLDPHNPITLISGPSATSDIELQRVEGVHGPRTLTVVIIH